MSEQKEKSAPEMAVSGAEKKKTTNNIISQAKAKIKTNAENLQQREKVIAEPTAKALHTFCEQSEEFSRAVIQTDKTFDDCLKSVVSGIKGNAVSDLEVYQSAVEFYFPGAKIEFRMLIHMSEYETETEDSQEQHEEELALSLDSLLDW